jgi:hypothetical protein
MSYLRNTCLFAYSGAQHILCCVVILFPEKTTDLLEVNAKHYHRILYRVHLAMYGNLGTLVVGDMY